MTEAISAAAYRQRIERVAELETGIVVRLRMVDPLSFLGSGEDGMPNPLLAVVARAMKGGAQDAGRAAMQDPQAVGDFIKRLNGLVIKALVEPPLIEQGHADGLSVDELSLDDKMAIFGALMGGGAALDAVKGFPGAASAGVEPAPDGEQLRQQAE